MTRTVKLISLLTILSFTCDRDNPVQGSAQDSSIRGRVVDMTGNGVSGAQIDVALHLESLSGMARRPADTASPSGLVPRAVECCERWVVGRGTDDTVALGSTCDTGAEYLNALNQLHNGEYTLGASCTSGDAGATAAMLIHRAYATLPDMASFLGYATTDHDGSFSFAQERLPFGESYVITDSLGQVSDSVVVDTMIGLWCLSQQFGIAFVDSIEVDASAGASVTIQFR